MGAVPLLSPDAVENVAVGINPQHDVLHGRVVNEGALGVDEEDVGDPDLLDEASVEGAALVAAGGEGQPVVLPVVPQVQSHGEVLENQEHSHPAGARRGSSAVARPIET